MKKKLNKNYEYKKNDLIHLCITDMGNDGEGIGKLDGYTFFVPNAVTGDEIEAVVTKVKKGYAYAHLKKIVKASPDRVEPVCPQARTCGGCTLQALSYEAQLAYKQNKVKNNLVRIGHFDEAFINEIMEPIIGMEDVDYVNDSKEKQVISKKNAEDETATDSSVNTGVFRYRNKSQFPVGLNPTNKDEPICGYYAAHSHRIVPVEDCVIGIEENKDIVRIIMDWMKEYHIRPYDETTGTGIVRHILIRKGFYSGEILVCPVVAEDISYNQNDAASVTDKNKNRKVLCDTPEIRNQREQRNNRNQRNHRDEMSEENSLDRKDITAEGYVIVDNVWDDLIERLRAIPGIASVCVNINPERTNVILGSKTICLWGKPAIEDTLCGITFSISAQSFYQVNPMQAERLYNTAISYAGLTGGETVWDLYCGIGTISLAIAKELKRLSNQNPSQSKLSSEENTRFSGAIHSLTNESKTERRTDEPCGQVYGVEIVQQAIEDAKENAKRNQIDNAHFTCGKAEDFMDLSQPDIIVVDPPRKGLAQETIDIILQKKPKTLVYVSCDSATLARDLRLLADGGYALQKVRPVDMFGFSTHVETVVLLSKGEIDSKKIKVEFSLEDMDMSEFQDGATYTQIKDYVLERSGLKVSNLYISQIKRKCGIVVGKNYNLPKSEDARQPKCPPEKEWAIMDALKHFGMI